MSRAQRFILFTLAFTGLSVMIANACTSILVTRGASADGSVIVSYSCDGPFLSTVQLLPAADHQPGDSLDVRHWFGEFHGRIPQVPHTFAVFSHMNEGLMNDRQVVIAETTFDGREELRNPGGLLDYWNLMTLALQRASTAREAITVMTGLVAKYGYNSTGESFSIADTREAWILEMIGTGAGKKKAVWAALRIPDGYISCHANRSRIGEILLNDPENCLYSPDVVSFAIEKGYYFPASEKPFRFNEAYCPATPQIRKYSDTRVWSIFRRAAPSRKFSPDYHRSVSGAEPYPLWVKPDRKLSAGDVMALMRDHYEGTVFDMTKGPAAGPFGSPNRCRPISWMVDSLQYSWERPISTPQTSISFVSQSRSWLPDALGGLLWFGMDDTYTTCYIPLYCGIDRLPLSFTRGNRTVYSPESAWWVFNFVSNIANLKFSYMIRDIQALQRDMEGAFLAGQPSVEKAAMELAKSEPRRMRAFLTEYSVSRADSVVSRWRDLGNLLVAKYNDGYVMEAAAPYCEKGYPEPWLREVVKDSPGRFIAPADKK